MNQELSLLSLNSDEVIASLTTTYLAQEAVQIQITQLLQAHQLSPSAENYYNLGVYLAQNEYWDSAIASFLHAISLHPGFVEAYHNLGAILQQQNQIASAIAFYQRAIALQPDAETYYQRAICLGQLQLEEGLIHQDCQQAAIQSLLHSLQLQPDFSAAYYALAEILQRQGNLEAAYQCDTMQLPYELIVQFYQHTHAPWQVILPSQSHPQVSYCQLHDPYWISLTTPKTIDSVIHPDLSCTNTHQSPATLVAEVQQGYIWCHAKANVVLTSDRKIISLLSHTDATILNLDRQFFPGEKKSERVALLSILAGEAFYHWLFELLPKIGLIYLAGIDLNTIDKFVVNACQSAFQKETLQLLGIPLEKVITSSQPICLQAETIIVPQFKQRSSSWSCEFLRQAFLPNKNAAVSHPEKIYISRKDARYRHLINEQDCINFLSQFGFSVVTLESYSFLEQVSLVANAKVVISVHGAGLSHLVFCQPQTKVIEIFPPHYVTRYYWILSNLVNLEYFYLMGEPHPEPNIPEGMDINHYYITEDFSVSLPKLLETLKLAEVI